MTVPPPARVRPDRSLSAGDWRRLGGFGAGVVLLHVAGVALLLAYAPRYPVLTALGWTAYLFGLRHAFDADHIAAIDNTTRKLVNDRRPAVGTGFFFSLGHSTVVFALALALGLGARAVNGHLPVIERYGGVIGPSVSGTFLWIIGILNLAVLLDIARIARGMKAGAYPEEEIEARLLARGLMNRFFGRFLRAIRASWQMYPLGLLFGLGFDTATEVGLLALSAEAGAKTIPIGGVLALPILFAAGMSLMDTADGAFMTHAYGWALAKPVRKIYYNLTVTAMSVMVALGVGTVELLQVLQDRLSLTGGFWDALGGLDLGSLGYGIAGLFVVTWLASYAIWKFARIEERWEPASAVRGSPAGPVATR